MEPSFASLSNNHDTLRRSLSLASSYRDIYVANEYSNNTGFLTILKAHTLGVSVIES